MGKLLEAYLAQNVPQLQQIVQGGRPQPEGATTFPMGPPPGVPTGPAGPMPAATGPLPPGSDPMQAPPGLQTAPVPSFDQPPQSVMPPAQAQPQQDRSGEFEKGPHSFMGMADKASKKDIKNAVNAMEEAGVNIDEAYAQITGGGQAPATGGKGKKKGGLSREEKGMILMEFGLSLMAQSGTGEGTFGGSVGIAASQAYYGHKGRKASAAQAQVEAEEREQQKRLTEAQIKKAERAETSIEEDGDGNLVIVNKQTGETTPVLMDGKPVQKGTADDKKLDFEVKKEAFKAAYGSQIKDAEELERRAVAFANSVREIAFPKLARQDAARQIMRELNKGDNSSQKFYPKDHPQGIRWKNMSHEQKVEIASEMVDLSMEAAAGGVTTAPAKENNFGLSKKDIDGMEPGKDYKTSDGKWVTKRDGKLVEVD